MGEPSSPTITQVHLLKARKGEMSSHSGIATSLLETLHNLEDGFAFRQIRQVNPLLFLPLNPMMLPSSSFLLVILMLRRPADWPLYPIAMAV